MTGGNSSHTTAGAPNRDEWKALYTCYRSYKSRHRLIRGPIPSTTGGGKVKAGSRTGCSSSRRGFCQVLSDSVVEPYHLKSKFEKIRSETICRALSRILCGIKAHSNEVGIISRKQYNHLASFGGFPDFGFPEHSKDEQDCRVICRRNNVIEQRCKQNYLLVTFRQSSFQSPHCFKVQTPLHDSDFLCVNGFNNFNSSLVSRSGPQN